MARKFSVAVKFDFEIDNYWIEEWGKWGYGAYNPKTMTLDNVKKELHTCLSGEFARDEGGLHNLPRNFVLEVVENDS